MCGIAGFQGRFPASLAFEMGEVLAHRGPDDDGIFRDERASLSLVHRRLAIQDLSPAGHQPMTDPSDRYTLVYNGEVYNFPELRRTLAASGVSFRGHSDTEVILALWAREGVRCLAKLNGIFALAVWDSVERTLTLARDGLGVKPLYIAEDARGVSFASEIKALLRDPKLDRSIDARAVRDHLSYMYCPGPRTVLRAVKKVAPGEWVRIKEGRTVERERFWRLPFDQAPSTLDRTAAAEAVRETVRTAVHRQMISDVPVGAFLSGGLDSSAVVAFAREKAAGGKLPCFTIQFKDDGGIDDSAADLPYARAVARHLDVELHQLEVDPTLVENLDRVLWHLDEPLADPAAINVLLISEEARRQGVKVLLGGTGGDDLFTGYRRHYALQSESRWSWLPRALRAGLRKGTDALPRSRPSLRRIAKAFAYADRSPDERLLGYFRWALPRESDALLAPTLRDSIAHDPFCAGLRDALDACPTSGAGAERLQRMLYLELSHFLVDHNLNYTDKLSMATGIEARVPLLDHDLVRLACSLPVELKQEGRVGKAVFKRALEGILPHHVIYRPKTGFGAPLRHWMRGELTPLVDELLSVPSIEARGLFDAAAVRSLVAADRAGRTDAAYTLFSVLCIERWCRLFLDAPVAASELHEIPAAVPSPNTTLQKG